MNYPKKIIGILCGLYLLLLYSCDPIQRFSIENTTGSKASIQFVFKNVESDYRFNRGSSSDTLLLVLDPAEGRTMEEYFFSMGHWKIRGAVDSLVNCLEEININTASGNQIIKGKDQLKTFFTNNISKKQKANIEIILQ